MSNERNHAIVYIGTYTSGDSEGIYTFSLNTESGTMTPLGLPQNIVNPSYLSLDRKNRFLYSVLETDEFEGRYGGAVASFSISGPGTLCFINSQPTEGKSPCHLSTDRENAYLFAANYSEGTITVFPLNPDGSICPASSIISHSGCGPNKARQEKAHMHYVTLTPDEKRLCAVDLGIDKVMIYDFDSSKGTLELEGNSALNINPGNGPRHMEFHPKGRFAYVINELSSDIAVFEYSDADGIFKELQYISALPEGYEGVSYCAAVHISPDGNYLYASNRGHDSIAVFQVDDISGKLRLVSHSSTLGEFPRDFAIDPTGKFLLAANQNSDSVIVFKIKDSGELGEVFSSIEVPNPVCIKIMPVGN